MHYSLRQKWLLFIKVTPYAIAFCIAKVTLHHLGWDIWNFDSLTGTLFAAATFILAFMLSGTLRDYYASAYMLTDLVNAVEAIADTNRLISQVHSEYDPVPLIENLSHLVQHILDWLQEQKPISSIEATLENLSDPFAQMLSLGNAPMISRIQGEQSKIRLLINRIQLIRDTDFIRPAYSLLQIFLLGITATLLLIHTQPFSQTLVISTLLFFVLAYLLKLIRDLDNPFQYQGNSSLDLDLASLHQLIDSLRQTAHGSTSTEPLKLQS